MRRLEELLRQVDHRSYPAYKSLKGRYAFPGYTLHITHVQGDPFAAPSSILLSVPGREAGFPKELYDAKHRRVMLQDYLLRRFGREVSFYSKKAGGSGKSGLMAVTRCGQEVLARTGCEIDPASGDVTVRMLVGFPAAGRTTLAMELRKILMEYIPACVKKTLRWKALEQADVRKWVETAENQFRIRQQMAEQGLIAFVADGSILPRESGVKDTPMRDGVRFQSPAGNLRVQMKLSDQSTLSGMGIPKGVTLIVGGGYHGKSTLLRAIERGVYDHIPGDGREYVLTDPSAMKIRAEDGRSIRDVDISAFIAALPNGKDTVRFSTPDASGSTSQAANVMEAILSGTQTLLIDEDTSATNFMVRDALMQRVVHREQEPIIPFVDRIRKLYDRFGISTVLVAGSSGAFFAPADVILQMEAYVPEDITTRAKREAERFSEMQAVSGPEGETAGIAPPPEFHLPKETRIAGFDAALRKERRIKLRMNGTDGFSIAHEEVELRYLEQIVDPEQVNALAGILLQMETGIFDGKRTLTQCVDLICGRLEQNGPGAAAAQDRDIPGNLAIVRRQEIYAMLGRYRRLRIMK